MTVSTTHTRINFVGNDVADTFDTDFQVDDLDSLWIYHDGVRLSRVDEGTEGITRSVVAGGTYSFGRVSYAAPPVAGLSIMIIRELVIDQQTDYDEYDPFPAATHERAYDKLTKIDQQQQDELDRTVKAPIDDDGSTDHTFPPYVAGQGIGWHATEQALDNLPLNYVSRDGDSMDGRLWINADDALEPALTLRALLGQSAPLQRWANFDGTLYARMSAGGMYHAGTFEGGAAPTLDGHLTRKDYVDGLTQGGAVVGLTTETTDIAVSDGNILVFNDAHQDALGEYNTASGIFTAAKDGVYTVQVSIGNGMIPDMGSWYLSWFTNSQAYPTGGIWIRGALNVLAGTPQPFAASGTFILRAGNIAGPIAERFSGAGDFTWSRGVTDSLQVTYVGPIPGGVT